MPARSLILALTLFGSTAFAIPEFDGSYECNAQGAVKPKIRLYTARDHVFLEGLDIGSDAINDGIPCTNSAQSQEGQGYKLSIRTLCDDSSIGLDLHLVLTQQNTDFISNVKITKVSEQAVTLTIGVNGNLQGNPTNYNHILVCQKI